MESPYQHHHGGGASSRPSLGFPLGTALLLVVIFSLSGIFSCCYHWDKLRRTLNLDHPNDGDDDLEQPTKPPPPPHVVTKDKESLTVIMPGDSVPKFIAMPCPPCLIPTEQEEGRSSSILVQVQDPPPPKPPIFPVPLYL